MTGGKFTGTGTIYFGEEASASITSGEFSGDVTIDMSETTSAVSLGSGVIFSGRIRFGATGEWLSRLRRTLRSVLQ
jgi:hypothetical protein